MDKNEIALHNLYHNYKNDCENYLKKYKNIEVIPHYTVDIHKYIVDIMKKNGDYKKEYDEGNVISGSYIADQIMSECEIMNFTLSNVVGYDDICLHIIRGSNNTIGSSYVKSIKKFASRVGINIKEFIWDSLKDVDNYIDTYKNSISCFILQRPFNEELMKHMPLIKKKLLTLTNSNIRDVDGFLNTNYEIPFENQTICNIPATADSVVQILSRIGIERDNQNVLILGQSEYLGIPLANLLMKMKYNVYSTNSKERGLDIRYLMINADIIISACGNKHVKNNFLFGTFGDKIIIDIGMRYEDNELVGDIPEEIKKTAKLYTPTKNGIGVVTIAVLMQHVLDSTLIQIRGR